MINFQLDEFVTRFRESGPGAVDHDMDLGLELMTQYEIEFESLERRRLQLGKYKPETAVCLVEAIFFRGFVTDTFAHYHIKYFVLYFSICVCVFLPSVIDML